MKILLAGSEAAPFAKVGGLADVLGALPGAFEAQGHEVSLVIPYYKKVADGDWKVSSTEFEVSVAIGNKIERGQVLKATMPGSSVTVYLIDNPSYFHRDQVYGTTKGDYIDNSERFIFFSRSILEFLIASKTAVDVIHCHDWQTALIPVYLRTIYQPHLPAVKTALTIHNLCYQGIFWHWDMKLTGLSWDFFNHRQLEFYGKVNFLKGGIVFADAITTVSRHYAEAVTTREHGCGLEDVLGGRKDTLFGIPNGVDRTTWNPAADEILPAKYSVGNLSNKAVCKGHMQRQFELPQDPNVPLCLLACCFDENHGLELIEDAADELIERGVQLAFIGTGDDRYLDFLKNLKSLHQEKVGICLNPGEAALHEAFAGADILLMPYKTCFGSIPELSALTYGIVPVASPNVGMVELLPGNGGSGDESAFIMTDFGTQAFVAAIDQAVAAFGDGERWQKIVEKNMTLDLSWEKSAREYLNIFNALIG